MDILLDKLIPVQQHSYSGLHWELSSLYSHICPHRDAPSTWECFFYTGEKKKTVPNNNFHIINVFTLGQMYVIPNKTSAFAGKKITPPVSEWTCLNTRHWTFCSITFSTRKTFATNVLRISPYSDIIAYICCPSVYLRVSVSAACWPVDCLWDSSRDADS